MERQIDEVRQAQGDDVAKALAGQTMRLAKQNDEMLAYSLTLAKENVGLKKTCDSYSRLVNALLADLVDCQKALMDHNLEVPPGHQLEAAEPEPSTSPAHPIQSPRHEDRET